MSDIEGSLVFTGQPSPAKKRDFIFFSENATEEFIVPSLQVHEYTPSNSPYKIDIKGKKYTHQ